MANLTTNLGELQAVSPESGSKGLRERIDYVLRGRKPFPWGDSVRLNKGAIGRLLKGQFPDPETLIPMCRVENLSLTWLIDGLGSPYLVSYPVSDQEAANGVRDCFADGMAGVLVVSELGVTPVMHMIVHKEPPKVRPYSYTCMQVYGGIQPGELTMAVFRDHWRRSSQLELDAERWTRLATGYMGATELFGWEGEPGGLFSERAKDLDAKLRPPSHGTRESAARYLIDSALTEKFHALSLEDKRVLLRMIEGLGRVPPDNGTA
jgi:hypothetical protein